MRLLFVCVGNSCRSQMAEAFARALGGDEVDAWSAGSRPLGWITPKTVQVMKERGVDLRGQRSKSLREVPDYDWDVVVAMGCGDACPSVSARRRLDWDVADPFGGTLEDFRRVRDDVEARVGALLTGARR